MPWSGGRCSPRRRASRESSGRRGRSPSYRKRSPRQTTSGDVVLPSRLCGSHGASRGGTGHAVSSRVSRQIEPSESDGAARGSSLAARPLCLASAGVAPGSAGVAPGSAAVVSASAGVAPGSAGVAPGSAVVAPGSRPLRLAAQALSLRARASRLTAQGYVVKERALRALPAIRQSPPRPIGSLCKPRSGPDHPPGPSSLEPGPVCRQQVDRAQQHHPAIGTTARSTVHRRVRVPLSTDDGIGSVCRNIVRADGSSFGYGVPLSADDGVAPAHEEDCRETTVGRPRPIRR